MAPVISVILPVYNSETYLGAAVESILNQTFRDFELFAIEGGSTDGSPAILAAFAHRDARVRIVRQTGRGLVCALNQGVSLASGEFLARMDGDDISRPERFEVQLAFLRANPGIAVVGSALTLIDGEGRRVREIDYPQQPSDVAQALKAGSALAHPSVMMRADAVRDMGGYREVLDHAEDYDLWLRMSERYPLANLSDRLLLYRHHPAKRGCLFAFEQELHTQFARLSAAARRAGSPDPLDQLNSVGLQQLDCFALSPAERERVAFDLLGTLAGATRPEELTRVTEIMRFVGHRPFDRARLARQKLELGKLFFKWRRPAPALRWIAGAIRTDPHQLPSMLAALARRARWKLAGFGHGLSRFFQFRRDPAKGP